MGDQRIDRRAGRAGGRLRFGEGRGVVVDADLRVPGLGPDLAEELAVLVDAVATVLAVVDHREAGVAVFRGEVGPVARQVMGMGVDLQHAGLR